MIIWWHNFSEREEKRNKNDRKERCKNQNELILKKMSVDSAYAAKPKLLSRKMTNMICFIYNSTDLHSRLKLVYKESTMEMYQIRLLKEVINLIIEMAKGKV